MIDRRDILREARSLVGTGWRRMGRGPDGVDCAGVVAVVAARLGYPFNDLKEYRLDGSGSLRAVMATSFDEVEVEKAEPGDVLLFRVYPRRYEGHCAFLAEDRRLIHVYHHVRKVVEQSMSAQWESSASVAMRFRGAEPWQP